MELTYEKSNHDGAMSPPKPVVAGTESAAATGPQLTYDQTDKPVPQGMPPEHLPDEIRALRDADDDRRMYSPQVTYRDAGLEDALAIPEIEAEEQSASAAEYREIFADHGMAPDEAREVVQLARGLTASPPDEATQESWRAEAWRRLVDENGGEKGAREALELAQRLTARDPRVGHILEATRLGNHPRVIAMMVSKARTEKARGRL